MLLDATVEAYLRRVFAAWEKAGNKPTNVSIEFEPGCRSAAGASTPWIVCVIGKQNYRSEAWALDKAFEEMILFAAEEAMDQLPPPDGPWE